MNCRFATGGERGLHHGWSIVAVLCSEMSSSQFLLNNPIGVRELASTSATRSAWILREFVPWFLVFALDQLFI